MKCLRKVLKEKKQMTFPHLTYFFFCCEVDQCIISSLPVTELFKLKNKKYWVRLLFSRKDTREGMGEMSVFCKGDHLLS